MEIIYEKSPVQINSGPYADRSQEVHVNTEGFSTTGILYIEELEHSQYAA